MSVRNDILDAVVTGLETISVDIDYPITVNSVTRFWTQTNVAEPHREPLIMVLDGAPEILVARDASNYRFACDLKLFGYVKTSTEKETQDELNKLDAAIKQWIYSVPDLGDNCLAILYRGSDGNVFDEVNARAWTRINCRIIYYAPAGSF